MPGGKFTDTLKQDYLQMLRDGDRRMAAAEAIQVSYSTIWRHMQSDDDFARAVEVAERRADEEVENALYMAAISGNLTAIQVWLYNRWPDKWKDQRGRAELYSQQPIEQVVDHDDTAGDEEESDPGQKISAAANPDRVIELSKWLRDQEQAETG